MKQEQVVIGLTNPKSITNVGAVMRAAGCFKVDQVWYSGERYDRASKMTTDTKQARSYIPLVNIHALNQPSFIDAVEEDVKIVCVDLIPGATPLPAFKHPPKALYIFGPEDGTIDQKTVDRADFVVFIPTVGCLNLAASVNVLLYDRLAKSSAANAGDALILASKDVNNNVTVRR